MSRFLAGQINDTASAFVTFYLCCLGARPTPRTSSRPPAKRHFPASAMHRHPAEADRPAGSATAAARVSHRAPAHQTARCLRPSGCPGDPSPPESPIHGRRFSEPWHRHSCRHQKPSPRGGEPTGRCRRRSVPEVRVSLVGLLLSRARLLFTGQPNDSTRSVAVTERFFSCFPEGVRPVNDPLRTTLRQLRLSGLAASLEVRLHQAGPNRPLPLDLRRRPRLPPRRSPRPG